MVNMRQALGVDDFNQMSNYTGQLQNQRRSVGQKDYGLGGKALDMAAALGDAYNQYQPPETALGMMALPAKAVYGLGNMIVQDVGDKTKSIMGTDRSNPAAMNQAATDAFGLAADTMAGGGVVSRMTDMPQGAILGANVFQGGPHKYGPEGASESLKHMSKGEGAQAYGYGRYDAENIDVAEQYRINLAYNPDEMKVGGKQINELYNDISNNASRIPVKQASGEYEKMEILERLMQHETLDDVAEYAKNLSPETAAWVDKTVRPSFETFGNLYKHDLPDEDIARYLDYDASIKGNPQLESIADKYDVASTADGATLYGIMEGKLGKRGASEALAKAGIPGLKYFDGMSRDNPKQVFVNGMPIDSRDIYGNIASDLFVDAGGDFQVAIKNAKSKDAIEVLKDWANDPGMAQITDVGTRNFVTWDQDVLNRMKLLERNNEDMTKALMPK